MSYKNIEENSAIRAEKRKFYLYENKVFINYDYVTFNIIELNKDAGKITVNICYQGRHTIDTFELLDLDGWTYFEYGNPIPEKIYIDDFKEIK